MSQDQQDRLQRLRAARGEAATRLEPVQRGRGSWPSGLQSPQGRSRGHGGALVGLILLAVIAAGAIGAVAYALHQFHSSTGGPKKTVAFVVRQGEGVNDIANDLQKEGLLSGGLNSMLFRLYYQFSGNPSSIIAGKHMLNSDMSMDQIATALSKVPPIPTAVPTQNQYHILAGKRADEVAAILNTYHIASYDAVTAQVKKWNYDYWFLKGLPANASLEGFLAPGEYTLLPNSSPHSVVALMLRQFGQDFTPAMAAEAKAQGHSVFDVVTMASIVQRESSLPNVQKAIAGVLWNRLKEANASVVARKLNADPTVQYALGYSSTEKTWWRKTLTTDDYNIDSPYNTYLNPGLPAGPISNPGPSALAAALNPTPSKWLFYYAAVDKKGKSVTYFCETYSCHLNGDGVPVQ
ncbi:MAG: aminodeoxychorismate lyase [Chloroflexi bacterium]|nr:aminodeoxychorismate lyase [Chloroflexota bacterium]